MQTSSCAGEEAVPADKSDLMTTEAMRGIDAMYYSEAGVGEEGPRGTDVGSSWAPTRPPPGGLSRADEEFLDDDMNAQAGQDPDDMEAQAMQGADAMSY